MKPGIYYVCLFFENDSNYWNSKPNKVAAKLVTSPQTGNMQKKL